MSSISNSIKDFRMEVNDRFVEIANACSPEFYHDTVEPVYSVDIGRTGDDWTVVKREKADIVLSAPLKEGDSVCFDFGDHQVGYVTIGLGFKGSPPDAPAFIKIKFGELPCEIGEKKEDYHGSIGAGWIQEEFFHIDEIPSVLSLNRRYAFRYMEICVLNVSPKYALTIESITCETVTSADYTQVEPLQGVSERVRKLDSVSLKTMAECMQDVFEDGPKRDRRLWIGDLRLQALTNYETFHNNTLAKRCLYLFAGLKQNEGRVGACLFTKPNLQVDDTALFDYSLFFVSCLKDYYEHTGDRETLVDLWDTAYRQIELSAMRLDASGLVQDSDDWWCFLDWADGLNKQAGVQAILIYSIKQAIVLAEELKDGARAGQLKQLLERVTKAAIDSLWDKEKGLFVSGANRQVSWASQIWMIIAQVFDCETNIRILENCTADKDAISMVTPYMYHHYVEALICNGMKDAALEAIDGYWGQMIDDGADCYFELYDPQNKYVSPYGSRIINSYCHAWSGTPAYFIRKYGLK